MHRTRSVNSRTTQASLSIGILLIGLWTAWMIGGMITAQNDASIAYVAVAIAMCIIAVSILNNWRSGFYIFISWLLFEDLIRKFMGNNMVIYFAKDALLLITYLSYFAAVRRGRAILFHFPFAVFLSMFFWLGVLQCFNPGSPSFLYSLLGFKLYFIFIPLSFVGYSLLRTEEDLQTFLAVIMGWAGLIAGLGILQSIAGPSFLNPSVLAPDIRDLSMLYRASPE